MPAVSAVFGTALMVLLLVVLLIRYFSTVFAPQSRVTNALNRPQKIKGVPTKWPKALWYAIVWFTISRLLIFSAVAAYGYISGTDGYFSNMYGWWAKWDAPHYLGLIRNWYVNEGDPRFHIVFFPMYPLVCRLLLPLFGGNADISAMAVSNICAWLSGALLCRLTSTDQGEMAGRRAVRYFFFNPLSFFLSLPYTESMFILLTLSAVYLARRRRYIPALLIGAMCAACRLMGIVVAIPIYYSMLSYDRDEGTISVQKAVMRFFSCFVILLGAAAYLFLNWRVTGNPFQFWVYQKEHWHNTTGTLWNTFSYIVHYALYGDMPMRLATWAPTIVLIYSALILLFLQARTSNAGDCAYGWAYMYMTIVPTWLISGPRYVSGLYCLYPMLAERIRSKRADIAVSVLFALGACFMACMFVFTSGVY